MTIQAVALEKAYRLLTHGPTVLVSARFEGIDNVMAAAWACALDFAPPKVTVVLDKITYTRTLIEKSGYFALQIPTVSQLELTHKIGSQTRFDNEHKLTELNVPLFTQDGIDVPLVQGCSAWLICKLISEPHNQQAYDLFIGEVTHAFADDRVFSNGRWHFEDTDQSLRSIHHVAGGHYYAIGEALDVKA